MNSCAHCELPVGRFGRTREVLGEPRWFCCYGCCLAFQVQHGSADEPEAAAQLLRLGLGAFLAMNIMLFSWLLYAGAFAGEDAWLRLPVLLLLCAFTTPLLLLLGGPFFAGAWAALRAGRADADLLVTIGVLAAYAYSCVQLLHGSEQVYFDTATMVLLLFTLGRWLEARGRAQAVRSLAPMLAAERGEVQLQRDGQALTLAARELLPGDLVQVAPGTRVPVDGIVLEGRSSCDESLLSGQATPLPKAPGDAVVAGSMNGSGALRVRASVAGGDTRWAQIGRAVRAALAAKSLRGPTVDRAAAAFVPLVLLLAGATAVYWATQRGPGEALLAALAVLVVACPCSLGLAASLAATLAIAEASRRGILVRSSAALETLARVRGIAFDKTGTLTLAPLRLQTLVCDRCDADAALRRGGALASGSLHPLARAVAAQAGAGLPPAEDLQERSGAGLCGRVEGVTVALGSLAWMQAQGWQVPAALAEPAPAGSVQAWVGWEGQARAVLRFGIALAPEAPRVVAECHARGLRTRLLSGDAAGAVNEAAARLGVHAACAGLSPEAKLQALRAWRVRLRGPVAMVGDGLNDGPVLAAANVGIAVGQAAGGASDLARESADIVLPPGGLGELPGLLALAARLRRSVRANLAWAFGYNAIALALAASGWLQPVLAAALMAGSTLIVAARSWAASRRVVFGTALLAATTAVAAHDLPPQAVDRSAAGWPLAPFTLADAQGQPFTQQRLQGRWTFLLLADADCAIRCSAALAAAAGVQQRIARAEVARSTQVVQVALDGRPAADPHVVAVSGPRAALDALVEDLRSAGGAEPPPGALLLIGPDGSLRAAYLPPFDVPYLTADFLKTRVQR